VYWIRNLNWPSTYIRIYIAEVIIRLIADCAHKECQKCVFLFWYLLS
jgi:hypothetical protein